MIGRRMPTGWPVVAGLLAIVAGFGLLAGAATMNHRADELAASVALVPALRPAVVTSPAPESPALIAPPYFTQLDDVSALFRVAKQQGVALGPINYSSESLPSLPVVVRIVELHVDEDYPKLKAFVAELLRTMPHAYLREIRVEQNTGASTKVRAVLQLSFVYQTGSDSAGSAPGASNGKRG
ncbi:hypothetical protein [Ramlibacter sp.]|uniref:hypothetical protein n=1 Tax=Ramlibacter sp. TaxID=1917967 RepID=UPI0017DE429D|nr:hypothetical protein [Ramlibacter sp.]MBA2673398.1 hypothetical protein [Ramlibacter sp.]